MRWVNRTEDAAGRQYAKLLGQPILIFAGAGENLRQMVEWMPKVGYNILVCPLDYGGNGRVRWDQWRAELTPELKKRGIMIEVGGIGYVS